MKKPDEKKFIVRPRMDLTEKNDDVVKWFNPAIRDRMIAKLYIDDRNHQVVEVMGVSASTENIPMENEEEHILSAIYKCYEFGRPTINDPISYSYEEFITLFSIEEDFSQNI